MASLVLDASFLIALFDGKDPHHDWAVDLLIHTTDHDLYISALTLAEALVHPTKNGTAEILTTGIETLGVSVVPVTEKDVIDIATTRATSGLRMPDAIVLHTALSQSASLATADNRLTESAVKMKTAVFCPELFRN